MATKPEPTWLETAVKRGESPLLDFKQEWPDLAVVPGKAELVKDVLAIANSLAPGGTGSLVYGVVEKDGSHSIAGTTGHPSEEQVSQIIASFTAPVPAVEFKVIRLGKKEIGHLTIAWTDQHPYWATRDCHPILSSEKCYIRRGSTVGFAKPQEIEAFFRQKNARLGPTLSAEPLMVGFVQDGSWAANGRVLARVVSVSEEPVEAVSLMFDVSVPTMPGIRRRERRLAGKSLSPGESVEVEFDSRLRQFYGGEGNGYVTLPDWGGKLEIMDLRLIVSYRDRYGFIQQVERLLHLAGH